MEAVNEAEKNAQAQINKALEAAKVSATFCQSLINNINNLIFFIHNMYVWTVLSIFSSSHEQISLLLILL